MSSKKSVARNENARKIIRKTLIERDGADCYLCKKSLYLIGEDYKITFDHLHPLSHGGSLKNINNIKLAHYKCNYIRSDNNCPVCIETGIICVDKQILKLKEITNRLNQLEDALRNRSAKKFFNSINSLDEIYNI